MQSSGSLKNAEQALGNSLQQHTAASEDAKPKDSTAANVQATDWAHRAKPRGLSSEVEQTVSRLSDKMPHARQAAHNSSPHGTIADDDASNSAATLPGAAHTQNEVESSGRESSQGGQQSASSNESSPQRGLGTGQGRPPLSPVRQSQPQTALSNASTPGKDDSSIQTGLTGAATQDMNVHCNPLFTEPARLMLNDGAQQQQGIGRGTVPQQSLMKQQEASCVHKSAANQEQGQEVLQSPPSKLQQSLRMMMQKHSEGL